MYTEIQYDLYRLTGKTDFLSFICCLMKNRGFRVLYYHRILYRGKSIFIPVLRLLNRILQKKMPVEIPITLKLGKGALLLHPYAIVINKEAVIGDNFTILKGATVGSDLTKNIGVPVIGNNVYIGLNSTVVGGVSIGNNVMIAANTFVNFDVPDGSIVIGSPGVIHRGNSKLKNYIMNSVEQLEESAGVSRRE